MIRPIFILLPVHNRKEITLGFVQCLRFQTHSNYHLIVIDDGSTDGTADAVKEILPGSTILQGSGDLWWAGSLQKGLDWLDSKGIADDSLVLMINDDVRFATDYLERASELMAKRKNVLMLSQFLDPESGAITETGVHADFRHQRFTIAQRTEDINCLSTRGLFLHWISVRRIGRLHTRLLPHYASDYEYTIRAYRKGLSCETSPELLIVPNHDTTGFHVISTADFRETMGKYFSRKTPSNPFYWSSFILLACEPQWIIPNLARTWLSAVRLILRAMLRR